MNTPKYSVNQQPIQTVLWWVRGGQIAIPEIQRPFVWDAVKVRDLVDSLYRGYPIGYLICWKNPDVRSKDGSVSHGKTILIDGQQRVTALAAALEGHHIVDKSYKRTRMAIAFNPIEDRFEVPNPAIRKDPRWISDISVVFSPNSTLLGIWRDYCDKNPDVPGEVVFERLNDLSAIIGKQIGLIDLAPDLDIDTVTEIFVRINSMGVPLSQADFAMSKIAVNERYGGPTLRKCIDYFCHAAIEPEFYQHIAVTDKGFAETEYLQKMAWLANDRDDLYDPNYTDVIRVAFTSEFGRGRLSDLVSLLSGRNFDARTYEEDIAGQSFDLLRRGILSFISEANFQNLVMIIKSAGFIAPELIRSRNALNFAYVVYLQLRKMKYPQADIESYVRRWFAMSVLIARYSQSAETRFDDDIRRISRGDFAAVLSGIEEAELSDAFWNAALVQNLDTSSSFNPLLGVYLAAQVRSGDKGFLSSDITVASLIENKGDVHHIFPRDYLKAHGLKRGEYNQVANYAYMQSEPNIRIGNKPPEQYMADVVAQCSGGELRYGGIRNRDLLEENLRQNCIPLDILSMKIDDYQAFLQERRRLMAKKIRDYYFSL